MMVIRNSTPTQSDTISLGSLHFGIDDETKLIEYRWLLRGKSELVEDSNKTKTSMNDAETLLVPHCVRCAYREAPVVCTRCNANEYCSEIHQTNDTQRHRKGQCKAVIAAREKLREEEDDLRTQVADGMFLPEDVFETGVGDFYAIHETRDYMSAKLALVTELANVGSYSGMLNALEEASDALRLDEQDHLEFREPVPAFLILMGRFQEAYDFIRYWATHDDDQDGDDGMDGEDASVAPCFRKRGASMLEPVELFTSADSNVSLLHLCGLAFLKLMLSFGIHGAIIKLTGDDVQAKRESLAFLQANNLPTDEPSLRELESEMKHHATQVAAKIVEQESTFWYPILMPKMIDPMARPWHSPYADMFHWFPPAHEAIDAINTAVEPRLRVDPALLARFQRD
jgi:hypothetical protein